MPKTGTVPTSATLKTLFKAEVPTSLKWMNFLNRSGADRTLDVWFKPQAGDAVPIVEGPLVLNDGDKGVEDLVREMVAGDEIVGLANGDKVTFEIEAVRQ
jgi:hypothetical protein